MARYKSKPKRQDSIVEESHDETAPLAATETATAPTVTATETAPVAVTAAEATPAPSIPETNTSPAIPEPITEPQTATVTPPSFFRRFLSWIPIVNRWA